MEIQEPPRKSCDFCYLRKMRCDRKRPCCSHCITYVVDCTYTAPSRRSKPRSRMSSTKVNKESTNLQSRLQRLETLLEQQTSQLSRVGEMQNERAIHSQRPLTTPNTVSLVAHDIGGSQNGLSSTSLELPPLEQATPLVHAFLENFNTMLPLVHAKTFLHLFHNLYNVAPGYRDPVKWAAINVVLSLAYRQGLAGVEKVKHAVEYLGKAQSVLSDIVLGDVQLLNVQVLVGMVMLMQASRDLQPSLVLIATTLRLAHKIGLHNRAYSGHLDLALARQRRNVFWLAYILDKDLSLRTKQPSVQLDDDIDLELPGLWADEDGADHSVRATSILIDDGTIVAPDGLIKMNYFLKRIQLAVIEGGVYDYLYSTRSQKRCPEVRLRALDSVSQALEEWKVSVPPEFTGFNVSNIVCPDRLPLFCVLNATSLLCRTCINEAHAWNTRWIAGLRGHRDNGTALCLPPQWEALVDEARELMGLFRQWGSKDQWNFWITGCSYMTAMLLLTANGMNQRPSDKSFMDKELVQDGLQLLNEMLKETRSEALEYFRDMCTEFHQYVQRRHGRFVLMA